MVWPFWWFVCIIKKGKLHEYWQGCNFERNVDQGVSCLRRSLYGKLILRKIVKWRNGKEIEEKNK